MNFNDAFNKINEDYEIKKVTLDSASIETGIMVNDFNELNIGLIQKNNQAVLTDYADLVNDLELDIENVKNICKKYNVGFENYHIETIYNSEDDLENYLDCIEEIIDTIE